MSVPRALTRAEGISDLRETVRGHELAALEAVPAGSVRGAALLVPGITGSKEDFLDVLPALRADDYHVLAYDQRGQFESSHGPAADYEVPALAADAVAMATSLAERSGVARVHLLGHSFGGLVARGAVLDTPEAFASLTLLCSGPAAVGDPSAARLRQLIGGIAMADGETLWDMMAALDAEAGLARPPAPVLEFLRTRWLGNDLASVAAIARTLLEEPDRTGDLADVLARHTLAALVVHGATDDAWPHDQQAAMARRLDGRYVVIPDAGHSPAAENPAATAALLASFWG